MQEKTQLVRSIVEGRGGQPDEVTSPTFVLLNIYPLTPPIYHYDTYRLMTSDEFLDMGGEEKFYDGGICLVEWPRLIEQLLPEDHLWITIEATSVESRLVNITAHGQLSQKIMESLERLA